MANLVAHILVLAGAIFVSLYLLSSWGASDSSIARAAVNDTFSPERCAELHNQLMRKALGNATNQATERNLLARFLESAPIFAQNKNLYKLPLHRFLSLLETTAIPDGASLAPLSPLTPEMYQPDPESFWSETFHHVPGFPGFILLYTQNNADSPMDGGLFLDLETYRAVWHESDWEFPPAERWVSLESVLQRSLEKWNRGIYFWDSESQSISMARWAQSDLSEALSAWDVLLSTIEGRLYSEGSKPARLEPLDNASMEGYRINDFSRAFLSRAARPRFARVAPGITTFSPESLAEIYGSEPADSYRRTSFDIPGIPSSEEEQEWASLILPGTKKIRLDGPEKGIPAQDEASYFDKPWGFGKFTLNRWAGLYSEPGGMPADTVRLVTPDGHTTLCDFEGQSPWARSRSPRLAEVLLHWASFVEDGTWLVGPQGVEPASAGWFDSHPAVAAMSWSQTSV
ncbi:hypothetical protein GQ53DRAFT_746065 [Thozetella sp. PMI_491]|nr:hypothetical protein GQ53DRAFT_746065 [Thozetella sp. PMI_491]